MIRENGRKGRRRTVAVGKEGGDQECERRKGKHRGPWRRRGGGAIFWRRRWRRPVAAATAAAGRLHDGDT